MNSTISTTEVTRKSFVQQATPILTSALFHCGIKWNLSLFILRLSKPSQRLEMSTLICYFIECKPIIRFTPDLMISQLSSQSISKLLTLILWLRFTTTLILEWHPSTLCFTGRWLVVMTLMLKHPCKLLKITSLQRKLCSKIATGML